MAVRKTDSLEPTHESDGFAALEAKVEEILTGEAAYPASQAPEVRSEEQVPQAMVMPLHATVDAAPTPPSPAELRRLGAPLASGLNEFSSSLSAFGYKAVSLQLETWARLAGARGPQDVLAVQLDYGQKAAAAYLDQVARASNALLRMTTESPVGGRLGARF